MSTELLNYMQTITWPAAFVEARMTPSKVVGRWAVSGGHAERLANGERVAQVTHWSQGWGAWVKGAPPFCGYSLGRASAQAACDAELIRQGYCLDNEGTTK